MLFTIASSLKVLFLAFFPFDTLMTETAKFINFDFFVDKNTWFYDKLFLSFKSDICFITILLILCHVLLVKRILLFEEYKSQLLTPVTDDK